VLEWLWFLLGALPVLLRSRRDLALEHLLLRQQLAVALRTRPRPALRRRDRLFWGVARRVCADWRRHLVLVRPATVRRGHRRGWRLLWWWRSGRRPPRIVRRATARLPEYRSCHCSGKDCLASRRDAPCPRPSVQAADLETAVWAHVRQRLAEPDRLLAQVRHFGQAAADGGEAERAEARRLAIRLERLRQTDERLVD
jgi:hypothetical protein